MHSNLNSSNNNSTFSELPALTECEKKHSDHLFGIIKDYIVQNGAISFSDYMRMALYEPSYGYYLGGQMKFGGQGDFITAPEVSSLFSYALANQCAEIFREIKGAGILEFGAGSGKMASDLLSYLEKINSLPTFYWIVELSAELKQRQLETLQHQVPHLLDRVVWLSDVEGLEFEGVVLANEVIDAMPVHRFVIEEGCINEVCIDYVDDSLVSISRPASRVLCQKVQSLQESLAVTFPEGYLSEVNLNIHPWLSMLSRILKSGVVLCIDYGYPRQEYYMREREEGTLMCHYKHRAHDNALLNVGLQDITAYVDFTDVVEAGTEAGLVLEGFTTQANFLSACGINKIAEELMQNNQSDQLKLAQQIKILMLPGEMGERFKVMGLSRNYKKTLSGFTQIDYSTRL